MPGECQPLDRRIFESLKARTRAQFDQHAMSADEELTMSTSIGILLDAWRCAGDGGSSPNFPKWLNFSQHALKSPRFRGSLQATHPTIGEKERPSISQGASFSSHDRWFTEDQPLNYPSLSISHRAYRASRTPRERQRAMRRRPNLLCRPSSPTDHSPPPSSLGIA
jgi:hypothetical protein